MYLAMLSRVVTKESDTANICSYASHGHSNVDFHVFKKQKSESAICQSLNNPKMRFSVLYKSRNSKSTILKPETTMFSKGFLTVSGCLFCDSFELRCR